MKLYDFMYRCLNIPYTEVGNNVSFATERVGSTLNIYFEHSNGREDWRKNMNFPAKPYRFDGGQRWYAHRGFLSAWREMESTISSYISDKSVKKITVTGYSHGAAIALLCHEYIWYNRSDLRGTLESFGFGSPRVIWGHCDAEFAKRFETFTVIRNINDIVTHLPPAFLGYRHAGRLLTIGEKGKYSQIQAHYPENILAELYLYESERYLSFSVTQT